MCFFTASPFTATQTQSTKALSDYLCYFAPPSEYFQHGFATTGCGQTDSNRSSAVPHRILDLGSCQGLPWCQFCRNFLKQIKPTITSSYQLQDQKFRVCQEPFHPMMFSISDFPTVCSSECPYLPTTQCFQSLDATTMVSATAAACSAQGSDEPPHVRNASKHLG